MSDEELRALADWRTKPNPAQPDRCPSIDPHDTLQCARRIHEDDQCQCGGIAWRKGSPRYVSAEEKVAKAEGLIAKWRQRAELQGRGHSMVATFYDKRADELRAALSEPTTHTTDPEESTR